MAEYDDHDHHDHPMDMNMTNGTGPAGMSLHFGTDVIVLFKSWHVENTGELIGTMIAVGLMAFLFEALRNIRLKIAYTALLNNPYVESEVNASADVEESFNLLQTQRYSLKTKDIIVQMLLQMLMVGLGYVIMLVVMTYNVWLIIASVFGLGSAYATCYKMGEKYSPARALLTEGERECHM